MSTPFEFFRRHQKVTLAAVTGIAVLSFIITDSTTNTGEMSPTTVAALVIGSLAVVGWVWGAGSGKSGENAIFGGVLGLAITLVFMFLGRPPAVISAATGNVSQESFNTLRQQRSLANQMVSRVFYGTHPLPGFVAENPQFLPQFQQMQQNQLLQYMFGFRIQNRSDDLLITELLNREADELGIQVTDEAAMDFLKRVAGQDRDGKDQLTQEVFTDAIEQTSASTPGVTEDVIVDALRRELRAQRAYFTLYGGSRMTPVDVWDMHRKLNTRQTAQFVGLPVADFIDKDAKPSEADLKQTFEDYKANYPNVTAEGKSEPGRPGLYLDRRVRVAYLEPNYEEMEKLAGTVTEEEILARYEAQYKREMPPHDPLGGLEFEDELTFPQMPPLPDVPKAAPATPDPAAPAPEKPAEPAAPAPEKPAEEKPADPAQPVEGEKPADPAAKPDGASLRPRASQLQAVVLIQDQPEEATKSADAAPAAETPAAPASEQPAAPAAAAAGDDKPAAPATEEKPAGDTPQEDPAAPVGEKPPTVPLTVPPVGDIEIPPPSTKVRPLTPELRQQIHDELLAEKTRLVMDEKMGAARDFMNDLHLNVAEYLDHQRALQDKTGKYKKTELSKAALTPAEATQQLQDYAKQQGLVYTETPLLTFQELMESEDHLLGGARVGEQGQVVNVLAGSQPEILYSAWTAFDLERKASYAFWKIEDVKAHVPASLEEPGMKEMVTRAWRTVKARPLAEKRAQELADLVSKSDKPMAEALAEQTVTGKPENSLFVTVLSPGEFSWLERPFTPQQSMGGSPPRLAAINGVEGAGPSFMAKVFHDMKPGSVGVVPNEDRSIFYVTRIDTRTPGTEAEIAVQRKQFLESQGDLTPYAMQQSNAYVGINTIDHLFLKHGVRINRTDEEADE